MPRKPDWSRRLPRPLIIPTLMTLETLADVRKLILHLPAAYQAKATWQYVGAQLLEVANGADPSEVMVPLQMVLGMEGIACHAK